MSNAVLEADGHQGKTYVWVQSRLITRLLPVFVLVSAFVGVGIATVAPISSAKNSPQDVAGIISAFRTEMGEELRGYMNRYAARLSPVESKRINVLIDQSDSDLRTVERSILRVARWEARGNERQARKAAKRALVKYELALQRAEDAIAEMTPILRPKLNFVEALEANSTLNARMDAYERLNPAIRSLK